ncbi:MAG: BtpA/SgcQ family protein, partial [Planctomycetota bacterium]
MFPPGPVLGVVHLLPLPGSPRYAGGIDAVVARAVKDARAYAAGGADAVIVENYGDAPFFKADLPPE